MVRTYTHTTFKIPMPSILCNHGNIRPILYDHCFAHSLAWSLSVLCPSSDSYLQNVCLATLGTSLQGIFYNYYYYIIVYTIILSYITLSYCPGNYFVSKNFFSICTYFSQRSDPRVYVAFTSVIITLCIGPWCALQWCFHWSACGVHS